jgi:DNA polymerase-3 subunit alpha
MPDIDVDICWANRQRVIDYLISKYGEDRVAQIVTFTTLQPRSAAQDIGRVLRIPIKEIDALKSVIPEEEKISLSDLEENPQFMAKVQEIGEREPRFWPAMRKLEGLHRNESLHAGGIIISRDPINTIMPTFQKGGKGRKAVQYEMFDAEAVGGLKMDVLGLKTVTLTYWADKDIKKSDPSFNIRAHREDDQAAFDIINRGDTAGIFQVEGTGITRFAMEMQMESFNDVVALMALYRPGPLDSGMAHAYIRRKKGQEAVDYPHPDLEWVLKDTFGIIIYQEQVMQILGVMAGYTMGQADTMRKAIGKKDEEIMEEELAKFVTASIDRGHDPALMDRIANLIRTFARYGFPKAHAVAYGYLTYWTAVLKAHYPAAFYAAWLNVTEDGARQGWIIDQASRKNIKILPPDVNTSDGMFTMMDAGTVRFGLSAVKGMGDSFVVKTIKARETNGPFRSYVDYCHRLTSVPVDKKEALVASGAFDFDQAGHRAFLYTHARGINDLAKNKNYRPEDETSIYGRFDPVQPFTDLEAANLEKQFVNFHITADPLVLIRQELVMMGAEVGVETENLRGKPPIGGRITNVHFTTTKTKKQMAFVTVDDGLVQHSVTIFPEMWSRVSSFCQEDKAIFMRVDIGQYRGKASLSALHVEPLDLGQRKTSLVVDMGTNIGPLYIAQLMHILGSADQGRSSVRIWAGDSEYRFLLHSDLYAITVSDGVIQSVRSIFGPDSVSLKPEDD